MVECYGASASLIVGLRPPGFKSVSMTKLGDGALSNLSRRHITSISAYRVFACMKVGLIVSLVSLRFVGKLDCIENYHFLCCLGIWIMSAV